MPMQIICGEETAKYVQRVFNEYENTQNEKYIKQYMEEVKNYASKESMQTGMIMDATELSKQNEKSKESMEAAIQNEQIKKLEALAKTWKEAHTQKVREYEKIGRNEPCPCGSGLKYKNCCLKTGKYEKIVKVKK